MSAWHAGPFLAFDTEATGTDCDRDRIVTATCVWIDGTVKPQVSSWLIDPGVEIPEAASAIHGVTTEHARSNGRPPAECLEQIEAHLLNAWQCDVPVLAFNAAFDLTILDRELRRHGVNANGLRPGLVLDPFVIDKHCSYRRGKRTLSAQCEFYGVKHDGAHDATADALAAARVLWAIARKHPTVAGKSPADLHVAQIEWAAEQAASFREYLIAKGTTTDLPHGEWPMRAYTDTTERAA